ncbi:MAG: hypothetical protein LBH67_00585, partial [Rickettsia sp.]|nr:hypothetical protein [Rickettsia sp.]
KLQSFKNIRVDDFFCNFLDKRFCFFFLKLEQIFIFQRSLYYSCSQIVTITSWHRILLYFFSLYLY